MKPYYEEKGIQIWLGDCREVIPELGVLPELANYSRKKFDLLLTDPPYGIGRDGSDGQLVGALGVRKAYEFLGWDRNIPSKEIFELMFRVSCEQIIWGGNYFAPYLPPCMGWLVWDKGQRISQSDGELAFTSLDQALRIRTLSRAELNGDGAQHPTQKPIRLMKWCIGQVPWAKTVLDPFCGSGSTLLAAKDMGLKACGIEVNEMFCEISANRLRQGVLL